MIYFFVTLTYTYSSIDYYQIYEQCLKSSKRCAYNQVDDIFGCIEMRQKVIKRAQAREYTKEIVCPVETQAWWLLVDLTKALW